MMQYRPSDLDDRETALDAVQRVNRALAELWRATGIEPLIERLLRWLVRAP